MSFKFTSDRVQTVGDLFTMISTAQENQKQWVIIQRICDVCHKAVGDSKVHEYTCKECGTNFDVAHDCKVERTDLCPKGFGCQE